MSQSNPERGCGRKVHDAFYIEGGPMSAGGHLYPFTWLLGNGLSDFIFLNLPPRQMIFINPAATITTQELIRAEDRYMPSTVKEEAFFANMCSRTKRIGLGDHVGKSYYSPHSFAEETQQYGPSRRVTPDMAREMKHIFQEHGPIPFMFTHTDMPIFTTKDEMKEAKAIVSDCISGGVEWRAKWNRPVWAHPSWGQYAVENQWTGWNHYLVPILSVMHAIRFRTRDDIYYQRARNFFGNIRVGEQPFGMSWMTKVTYTLPKDGKIERDLPEGINVVDLDEETVDEISD